MYNHRCLTKQNKKKLEDKLELGIEKICSEVIAMLIHMRDLFQICIDKTGNSHTRWLPIQINREHAIPMIHNASHYIYHYFLYHFLVCVFFFNFQFYIIYPIYNANFKRLLSQGVQWREYHISSFAKICIN